MMMPVISFLDKKNNQRRFGFYNCVLLYMQEEAICTQEEKYASKAVVSFYPGSQQNMSKSNNVSTNNYDESPSKLQGQRPVSIKPPQIRFQMHLLFNLQPPTTPCVTSAIWSPSPVNPDDACPLPSWATQCEFAPLTTTIKWMKMKEITLF